MSCLEKCLRICRNRDFCRSRIHIGSLYGESTPVSLPFFWRLTLLCLTWAGVYVRRAVRCMLYFFFRQLTPIPPVLWN